MTGAAFVGGEKFLHGVGGVGTVVQDLRKGGMAGAHSSQRIAQSLGTFCAFFAFATECGQFFLKLQNLLLRSGHLSICRVQRIRRFLGIAANADGKFQQFVFGGFAAAQCFALVHERFFGLFLFAMQPQQAFASFGSALAQHFNASFGLRDLRHARLRVGLQFFNARSKPGGLFAQHGDGLPLRRAARFPVRHVSAQFA